MMKRLVLLLSLTGCAGNLTAPYWYKDAAAVPVADISRVAEPCGRADLWGCADRGTGHIFIKSELARGVKDCLEKHERTHLAGYAHKIGGVDGVWCKLGSDKVCVETLWCDLDNYILLNLR